MNEISDDAKPPENEVVEVEYCDAWREPGHRECVRAKFVDGKWRDESTGGILLKQYVKGWRKVVEAEGGTSARANVESCQSVLTSSADRQ